MSILIPVLLLSVFLIMGVPIAIAMGITGGIGIYMTGGIDSLQGLFTTVPIGSVASYTLIVVPMFILMGEFLTVSKIMEDLFDTIQQWFGRLKGGLAYSTVTAGAIMGALIGSSTAASATLGSSVAPQMKNKGYNTKLTMGVISASGTIAMLIPPRTMFILYGIMTETPIDKLFIAGILPGIITVLAFYFIILLWAIKKPEDAPGSSEKISLMEKIKNTRKTLPTLILLFFVIFSIYSGIATIGEASAFAAFGAFLIPLFMKRITLQSFKTALSRTLKTSTMIFTIIIGATIFSYYVTITRIPSLILEFIGDMSVNRWVIIVIFVIIYLMLGFFMDSFAMLTLTVPITFPVITTLGFDPIWFGVLVIKATEIGLCTPPLGMNVYVASSAAGESIETTFKGVTRFVLMDILVLAVLVSFPIISTILPNLMTN